MSALPEALAYASVLGWRVFLTAADCRTPIKGPGFEHGVHDATVDAEEMQRRFALYPSANLALACGGGLLALDIDAKGAVDGFSAWLSCRKSSATCRTPPVTAHRLAVLTCSSGSTVRRR